MTDNTDTFGRRKFLAQSAALTGAAAVALSKKQEQIGYFQSGDNPGRKEPGTGEINYRNVLGRIHELSQRDGRDLIIGMEHVNSKRGVEGELAMIQAYRDVDVR